MDIPKNTDTREFAPWFVNQIDTNLPETIYDGKYYDKEEEPTGKSGETRSLSKEEPNSVRLHLRKNNIIRNGHNAPAQNMYDFSLERMALHEVIAALLTHYAFESKEQFEDVCDVLEEEITNSKEFAQLHAEYEEYTTAMYKKPIEAHLRNMPPDTKPDDAKTDYNQKIELYKQHIAAFRAAYEKRAAAGIATDADALEKKQDEWALTPPDQYDKLVIPALREEDRIRWKEQALHRLICGEDRHSPAEYGPAGDPFEHGLLATLVKKLATPPSAGVPETTVTVANVTGAGERVEAPPPDRTEEERSDDEAISALFKGLKPLPKFSREDRKSFLVVGGQGAGKSTIISQIRQELGPQAPAAMLNTDWIKAMLLEPGASKVDDTQLGSILHAESSVVFDRAAEMWRNDAKGRDAAPHLIAEAAEAASWQTDLASAGGTRTDIRIAVVPAPDMEIPLKRAYRRAQQGGTDEGRFSPTPILLTSHGRRLFDSNLEAIRKGMPLTFYDTRGEPDTAAVPGLPEYPAPKVIAIHDTKEKALLIERLPDMLGYFGNRDLNTHACDYNEIRRDTEVATAGNMLKYARQVKLSSDKLAISYDSRTRKFTCAIDSWEDFCKEMGGEDKAKALIRALAEQHTLDTHDTPVFSVDFVPSEQAQKVPGGAEAIIAAVSTLVGETQKRVNEGMLDPSSLFHTLGRQLAREWHTRGNDSPAIDKLKHYASALKQLAEGAALSGTHDLRVIDCVPWIRAAYPDVLQYLRDSIPADMRPTEDEPQLLTFDTRHKFTDPMHVHRRIGRAQGNIERGKAPGAKDLAGAAVVRKDLVDKFHTKTIIEDSGVAVYSPKPSNFVAAFQVNKDTPIFDRLPVNLTRDGLKESSPMAKRGKRNDEQDDKERPEHSDWLVIPGRERADLKNALNVFFTSIETNKPDWEKALHALFHADGSARFGCSIMKHDSFLKNFRRVTQERSDTQRAMLTKIVESYKAGPRPNPRPGEAKLVRDPSDQKTYLLVQPETGKTYHLSTPGGGRATTVKGNDWFGIEVPEKQSDRDATIADLDRRLIYRESIERKEFAIVVREGNYVSRCCPTLNEKGQEVEAAEQVAEEAQPAADSGHDPREAAGGRQRAAVNRWKGRRSGAYRSGGRTWHGL